MTRSVGYARAWWPGEGLSAVQRALALPAGRGVT